VFGHGAMEPVAYQQTSNGELFYVDDAEVDVVAMATTEENIPQLASPLVNGRYCFLFPIHTAPSSTHNHWLSVVYQYFSTIC